MLADSLLPIPFWAEVVNTACYVQNRVLVTKPQNKTPCELLHGRSSSISFMRPFGCPVTILNTLDSLDKFKGKVDEGFLVGYFVNSKAFRSHKDYELSTSTNPISAAGPSNSNLSSTHGNFSLRDASQSPDVLEMENIVYYDNENVGAEADFNNLEYSIIVSPIPTIRIHNAHPISQIIGNLSSTTQTRSMARIIRDQGGISQVLNEDFHTCMFTCFLSQEEPKRVHQAFKDPSWIEAMHEELLQFKMQKVWILVDLPQGKRAIGRKFNFSKYIFESLEKATQSNEEEQGNADTTAEEPVTTVDDFVDQSIQSPTPLTPQPQQPQDISSTSQVQSPPPQQQSLPPALAQEHDKVIQDLEILKLKSRVKKLERVNKVKTMKLRRLRKVRTSHRIELSADTIMEDVSNQGRMTEESDKDESAKVVNEQEKTEEVRDNAADAQVKGRQADIYHIDMDHAAKVLSMQEDEPEIQEAVEVVTTTKLITEVVAAVSETVSANAIFQADIPTAPVNAAAVMTIAAPVKVVVPSTRRKRRGVVIRDP
nr:retrotransposon protein, putative, unclassified [Tanacetum cinerariifolium]